MYVRASVQIDLFTPPPTLDFAGLSSLSPVWCLLPCWGCCKWLLLSYSLCYKRGTESDCRRPGQLIMAENDPCPRGNVETVSTIQSVSSSNGFANPRRNFFPRTGKWLDAPLLLDDSQEHRFPGFPFISRLGDSVFNANWLSSTAGSRPPAPEARNLISTPIWDGRRSHILRA